MFITTTLGGIAAAVTISTVAGTVIGISLRPMLERTRDRITGTYRKSAEDIKNGISNLAARL